VDLLFLCAYQVTRLTTSADCGPSKQVTNDIVRLTGTYQSTKPESNNVRAENWENTCIKDNETQHDGVPYKNITLFIHVVDCSYRCYKDFPVKVREMGLGGAMFIVRLG